MRSFILTFIGTALAMGHSVAQPQTHLPQSTSLRSEFYSMPEVHNIYLHNEADTFFILELDSARRIIRYKEASKEYNHTYFPDGSQMESESSDFGTTRERKWINSNHRVIQKENITPNGYRCDDINPDGRHFYTYQKTEDAEATQYRIDGGVYFNRVETDHRIDQMRPDSIDGELYFISTLYEEGVLKKEIIQSADKTYLFMLDCEQNKSEYTIHDGFFYYSEKTEFGSTTREWSDSLGIQREIFRPQNKRELRQQTEYGYRYRIWQHDSLTFDQKLYFVDGDPRKSRIKEITHSKLGGKETYSIRRFDHGNRTSSYYALFDADSNLLREVKVTFDKHGNVKKEKAWYAKSERQAKQPARRTIDRRKEKKDRNPLESIQNHQPYMPVIRDISSGIINTSFYWTVDIHEAPEFFLDDLLYLQNGDSIISFDQFVYHTTYQAIENPGQLQFKVESDSIKAVRNTFNNELTDEVNKQIEWIEGAQLRYGRNARLVVEGHREANRYFNDQSINGVITLWGKTNSMGRF